MEIKTSTAKPLWLCDMLSALELRKVQFSKYGTEYKHVLQDGARRYHRAELLKHAV